MIDDNRTFNGQAQMGNYKPLRVSDYIPIKVVKSVPDYSGKTRKGLIKAKCWVVVVDFACGGVPDIHVRGGHVYNNNPLEKAEKLELYSDKYPVVTRVEYHFPHGILRNTYKNVCRFTHKVGTLIAQETINSQVYPLNIAQRGYVDYPCGQEGYVAFWQMAVRFQGDISKLFNQDSGKKNILAPRGGKRVECKYDAQNNETSMIYEFQDKVFGIGQSRAKKFEKQLEALRNKNKQLVALNQVGPVR